MSDLTEVFDKLKDFNNFGPSDEENLHSLAPIFSAHGAAITDGFYEILTRFPATNIHIEGRVEQLKKTHTAWLGELISGVDGGWGEAYFTRRLAIGHAHVRIGLLPYFVEAVMSFIRLSAVEVMVAEIPDKDEFSRKFASLVKILDLDLAVINLAYGEERLERLSKFTGMSRKLLERCINKAT